MSGMKHMAFEARGTGRPVRAGDTLLIMSTRVRDITLVMNRLVKTNLLSITQKPCAPDQCYLAKARSERLTRNTLREGGEVQERASIHSIALGSITGPYSKFVDANIEIRVRLVLGMRTRKEYSQHSPCERKRTIYTGQYGGRKQELNF